MGEVDGRVQGFVMFFYNYSTWVGRAGLHVEDFFVREAARGAGLGKRLLSAVAKIAIERKIRRVDLAVLEWNPARKLYEHLGFTDQSHWVPYRLEGEAIVHLANQSDS
jgi:GNAT superfamily N-acetyltransferase